MYINFIETLKQLTKKTFFVTTNVCVLLEFKIYVVFYFMTKDILLPRLIRKLLGVFEMLKKVVAVKFDIITTFVSVERKCFA